MDKQLEALTEAHKILSRAAVECAHYAASRPYSMVSSARNYIVKQANELIEPIFNDESREVNHG